jgi:hypothetical protein
MKGVVFTELIELVETQLGIEVAERMIAGANLPNKGAYTSVGTYDYHELLQMVTALSLETGMPESQLVRLFGRHLFGRFTTECPHFVANIRSTLELMPHVEEFVHVEVRKIHPDAELPTFRCTVTETGLDVLYRSSRPFADLAEGLIAAAIDHYGDHLTVERQDSASANGCHALFKLRRTPQTDESTT